MKNGTKTLASIVSAVAPVTVAYFAAGNYIHENFLEKGRPIYNSLESLANTLGNTTPQNLSDIATIGLTLALMQVAYRVALPLTRGFARVYGAKLED